MLVLEYISEMQEMVIHYTIVKLHEKIFYPEEG